MRESSCCVELISKAIKRSRQVVYCCVNLNVNGRKEEMREVYGSKIMSADRSLVDTSTIRTM